MSWVQGELAERPWGAAGGRHSPGAAVQLLCTAGAEDVSPAVSRLRPV